LCLYGNRPLRESSGLRASASAEMSMARVRQLRDAQKSGGTQSANISNVNRR